MPTLPQTADFRFLPNLNRTTGRAGIWMEPLFGLAGLRPTRALPILISQIPKPRNSTRVPSDSADSISLRNVSMVFSVAECERPVFPDTDLIASIFVKVFILFQKN